MKRCCYLITFILVGVAASGCIKRRLFWSPDGRHLAVLAEDGLRLSDPAGKLSDVIASDVESVAWLPDSRRFIADRKTPAATWEEAAVALTEERRGELIKFAGRVREEVLAYSGDWEQFNPKAKTEMSDNEFLALLLYVRDHRRQGLPEKLGEKWKEFEKLTAEVHLLQMYEVSDLRATPGAILTKTLDGIGELRIPRDGQALACVQTVSGGEHPLLRLSVLPVSGGQLRTVAEPVAGYPDWRADGQELVYATTQIKASDAGDALQLGVITARRVRDESGALLKEFPAQATGGIGVLFWPQMTVRCLRDGRIVFSAMEVTLPATEHDMPQRATLFSAEAGRPTVARLIPRDAEAILPNGLAMGLFEISPDEKRVAIASSNSANVSILTLATGEVQEILKEPDSKLQTPPTWRNSEELTIVVPAKSKWGSPNRDEVVLWSGPEKGKCLSCEWPVLFEKEESSTSKPGSSGNP